MSRDTLLIVDDEADMLAGLKRSIAMEMDCRILTAGDGNAALDVMRDDPVDVVLADIRMPGMDGLDLLSRIEAQDPSVTVIIMTAYGAIQKAVVALKRGAYDFIQKPIDEDRLIHLIRKGFDRNRLVRENVRLRSQMAHCEPVGELVGRSRPMGTVFQKIRMLAERERSPMPTRTMRVCSTGPTAAPSFSTRSAICRRRFRPSCCGCSRKKKSGLWGPPPATPSMSGSSRRPTGI